MWLSCIPFAEFLSICHGISPILSNPMNVLAVNDHCHATVEKSEFPISGTIQPAGLDLHEFHWQMVQKNIVRIGAVCAN